MNLRRGLVRVSLIASVAWTLYWLRWYWRWCEWGSLIACTQLQPFWEQETVAAILVVFFFLSGPILAYLTAVALAWTIEGFKTTGFR